MCRQKRFVLGHIGSFKWHCLLEGVETGETSLLLHVLYFLRWLFITCCHISLAFPLTGPWYPFWHIFSLSLYCFSKRTYNAISRPFPIVSPSSELTTSSSDTAHSFQALCAALFLMPETASWEEKTELSLCFLLCPLLLLWLSDVRCDHAVPRRGILALHHENPLNWGGGKQDQPDLSTSNEVARFYTLRALARLTAQSANADGKTMMITTIICHCGWCHSCCEWSGSWRHFPKAGVTSVSLRHQDALMAVQSWPFMSLPA